MYVNHYNYISNIFVQAIFYKKYSIKSDVWSFGCVMYEIWSLGYKPFEDMDGREVRSFICTITILAINCMGYALVFNVISSVLFST